VIALASLIVEPDEPYTLAAEIETVLEACRLPTTGGGAFQTTISTIAPSSKMRSSCIT
jgi:hypothetical protein